MRKNWHFLVFAIGALISVYLRFGWIGRATETGHYWMGSITQHFASNWYEEGLLKSGMLLYHDPATPEFPTHASRELYPSYPPFFVFPVWLLSVIRQKAPSIELIQSLGIFLHLLGALLVGYLALRLLKKYSLLERQAGFCAATLIFLFQFRLYFFYYATYFADTLVLPMYLGFLLLVLNDGDRARERGTTWAKNALLFLIALTDWYWVSITVGYAAYCGAKSPKHKLRSILCAFWPAAIAMTLYFLQQFAAGGVESLFSKFLWRIGVTSVDPAKGVSWGMLANLQYVLAYYIGYKTFFFTLLTIAVLVWRDKKLISNYVFWLILVPPVLHTVLINNHSAVHEFSSLKFYIPFAIICGAFLVASAGQWLEHNRANVIKKAMVVFFALCPMLYTAANFPMAQTIYDFYSLRDARFYPWVKTLHKPADILFSNQLKASAQPPRALAIVRKRIWNFADRAELVAWLSEHPFVRENPLLWLYVRDMPAANDCYDRFLREGGNLVAVHWNIYALRFSSVAAFTDLKTLDDKRCLAQ